MTTANAIADRHERRALMALFWPIFVSHLAQAGFGFVDTVMAGQVSPLDLAAIALGFSIFMPISMLVMGILMATLPLVASAWGQKNFTAVTVFTHQALYLAIALSALGIILLWQIEPIFTWMDTPPALRELTLRYLQAVSWGLPGFAIFSVLRNYCEAMSQPKAITLISLIALLFNIPANYVFIYGKLGFAPMGSVGCGWASALAMWLMAIMLLIYILTDSTFKPVRLFTQKIIPQLKTIQQIIALGLPIGIAIFFEVGAFCIVAILISPLGEVVVAGHQIALSISSLIFMLPLSFSYAMTIRTGQALGANDIAGIYCTRRSGLWLTCWIACGTALVTVVMRDVLASMYTDSSVVLQLATHLLFFTAAYQIVDALQVGTSACLRGLHDTHGPMVITLIAYWCIALPLGYVLGLTDLFGKNYGPYGFWFGLVLGLTVAAVLLSWRLVQQLKKIPVRPELVEG